MLQTVKHLKKFHVHASDGPVGIVKDLHFDDEKWTVRYIIVHTGSWPMGRNVLISPFAVRGFNDDEKSIQVDLTRERIENSPSFDSAKPFSRRHEQDYHQYYGWPYYWGGPEAWGWSSVPVTAPLPETEALEGESGSMESECADAHLRSANEIIGYHLHAQDEELGHVEDFVIQDATWRITDILVDTRNWWPGKKVLIPQDAIEKVSWMGRTISVALNHGQILNAPELESADELTPKYHRRVKQYYEQQMTLK